MSQCVCGRPIPSIGAASVGAEAASCGPFRTLTTSGQPSLGPDACLQPVGAAASEPTCQPTCRPTSEPTPTAAWFGRFLCSKASRNSPPQASGPGLTLPGPPSERGRPPRAAWCPNKWTVCKGFLFLQASFLSPQLDCFIYALDLRKQAGCLKSTKYFP